jgi:hypothetical protein
VSKILLFTHHDPRRELTSIGGGRELVSALNCEALRGVAGERLHVFTVPRTSVRGARGVVAAFRGHIDGVNERTMSQALDVIREHRITRVIVDGSNFGGFVRAVKSTEPHVRVSTFFHNAEARFFFGALQESRSARAAAVLAVNFLAERMAVRYSDDILCLSERDSAMLRRLYGRAATHIFPLSLQDRYTRAASSTQTFTSSGPYLLFVGGAFYANVSGMEWFVQNVAPRLSVKTVVVGKGFERERERLQAAGKVEIVGAVDDLNPWYRNALLAIAPVFDGSGMKTKVAEGLMYGKRIIGTTEAFSGYEALIGKPEWVCNTANEFITAIRRETDAEPPAFDPALRRLYEQNFSLDAARHRFASLVGAAE